MVVDTTAEQSRTAVGAPPGEQQGSDYSVLLRRVRAAGLFERRPGYYAAKACGLLTIMAGATVVFVLLGDSWWQLAVAAFGAVLFAQIGFFGHDACHQQIFRRRPANRALGAVCANLLVGLSHSWWTDKHNRHHANPNTLGRDPDIEPAGPLVFTAQDAHTRSRVGRVLVRRQAWLFVPLLFLEALDLHMKSVVSLWRRPGRSELIEIVSLCLHTAVGFTAVFLVMSPLKAVVFIAVQQGLLGFYLGCAFAPNHKGMPMPAPGEAPDYLRRQILTARNIRGGAVTDWVLGGLNYQIEHHLFPSMARPNLSRAQPLVRTFCAERGIDYHEESATNSYRQVLRHMHTVGTTA